MTEKHFIRCISTGNQLCDEKKNEIDPPKKPDDDDDDKFKKNKSMILKMLIWYGVGLAVLSFFGSSLKNFGGTITWGDFVNDLLATGEIESIRIRPNRETVLVYVHEGAVIRGQRVSFMK